MMRRISIGVLTAVVLIGVAWGIARWQRPALAADTFTVIDGDTLERTPRRCLLARFGIACIAQRLRLFGVDAFESKQFCRDDKGSPWPCGAVATARLRTLVATSEFGCHVDHEFIDRHAREFAVCTANGEDVGAILVREGLAFAYGRGAHYLPIESAAKAEKRGAWAGTFVRPQYFREGAVN
ncbi:MAG TPA: thermonuclease family protein [Stellaceae bacterium]|nr:thermonuclease family protein [Stellaceae bacterium]